AGVIAFAAAACGSSGGGGSTPTGGNAAGPHKGGSGILGAEQWPQCLNPITDCASASWYGYTGEYFGFPPLGEYSPSIAQENSALTPEVPSLDNGGIVQSPFSVTWHLNPKAVWSDGTPITCDDVDFTWKAILNTTGTYSTAGYTTAGGAA